MQWVQVLLIVLANSCCSWCSVETEERKEVGGRFGSDSEIQKGAQGLGGSMGMGMGKGIALGV